jgi:hypothetical protein
MAPVDPVADRYTSLRLPDFWADRAQAWFNHLEAECELRNPPITKSETKYHLATTALPASIRSQVKQILAKPPADCYTALKSALLALFVKTPLEEAFDLLKVGELALGDQLATTLYNDMRALWNGNGEEVFKALFLRALPQNLQDALAAEDLTADKLAARADKIIKNRRANTSTPSAINAVSVNAAAPCAAQQKEINAINAKYANKEKTAKTVYKEKDGSGICRNHLRYGKSAFSCRGPPCQMEGIIAVRPANTAAKSGN